MMASWVPGVVLSFGEAEQGVTSPILFPVYMQAFAVLQLACWYYLLFQQDQVQMPLHLWVYSSCDFLHGTSATCDGVLKMGLAASKLWVTICPSVG